MITEFNFSDEWDGINWLVFYAENFPIDLKINDEIWISDFKHLFKKGQYYCPENKISNDFLEVFNIPQAIVTNLMYGFQDGKVVKQLYLKCT